VLSPRRSPQMTVDLVDRMYIEVADFDSASGLAAKTPV
jgi:hypothetical protein